MPIPKVNKIYLLTFPLALNNLANQYPRNGMKDQIKTIIIEKNMAEIEIFNSNNLIIKG